jgi:hypothetical protein
LFQVDKGKVLWIHLRTKDEGGWSGRREGSGASTGSNGSNGVIVVWESDWDESWKFTEGDQEVEQSKGDHSWLLTEGDKSWTLYVRSSKDDK